MSGGIQAVCFDKDGTLFDFAATWSGFAADFLVQACGGDMARATRIGAHIGYDMHRKAFEPHCVFVAGTPAEVVEALLPHLPEFDFDTLLDLIDRGAQAAPQAPAVPLGPFLDDLAGRDLRLGVMTNDTEGAARSHLRSVGVEARFDFIAGFDSGFGAKPAPGPLQAFCQAVGVPAAQAVMVGDSTHDLIAGRRAGMWTVGVLTGLADSDTLAPHAECVLPDIGHLPGWLDQQAN